MVQLRTHVASLTLKVFLDDKEFSGISETIDTQWFLLPQVWWVKDRNERNTGKLPSDPAPCCPVLVPNPSNQTLE